MRVRPDGVEVDGHFVPCADVSGYPDWRKIVPKQNNKYTPVDYERTWFNWEYLADLLRLRGGDSPDTSIISRAIVGLSYQHCWAWSKFESDGAEDYLYVLMPLQHGDPYIELDRLDTWRQKEGES